MTPRRHMNKVAEITVYFWVMKILATTLGETSGDFLSMTLGLGYILGLMITTIFFLITLIIQLKSQKFHPVYFWAVIVGTTSVGTEISDLMDRTMGLGYKTGSIILCCCLFLTLGFWYYKEKNLKVYPIQGTKELFYWLAVLFSNSLGTAFGDFLSDNLGLSFLGGAIVCAGIIALVIGLHYLTRINRILLFWIAFVFTRPFGATFGDLLTKPIVKGGLNLGTLNASTVTVFLLALMLIYTHRESNKINNLRMVEGGIK
jgi:uncharacterized membrane-anchored protein